MYDSVIATIAALATVLSLMYDIWKDLKSKDEDSPRKEDVKNENGR